MALTLFVNWGKNHGCRSEINNESERPRLEQFVADFNADRLSLDTVLVVEGVNGDTGEPDPLRVRVMDIRQVWIEG